MFCFIGLKINLCIKSIRQFISIYYKIRIMRFVYLLLFIFILASLQCASGHNEVVDEIRDEFEKQSSHILKVSDVVNITDVVLLQSYTTQRFDSLILKLDVLHHECLHRERELDDMIAQIEHADAEANEKRRFLKEPMKFHMHMQELRLLNNSAENRLYHQGVVLPYDSLRKGQTINIDIYNINYILKQKKEMNDVLLYAAVDNSQKERRISFHTQLDNSLFHNTCVNDNSLDVCHVLKLMTNITNLNNHYNMKLSLITRIKGLCKEMEPAGV